MRIPLGLTAQDLVDVDVGKTIIVPVPLRQLQSPEFWETSSGAEEQRERR